MAEERDQSERSEEPTQKRLDEAIRRGDVVKSQEVNTWFIIGAAALNLMIFSGSMGAGLEAALRGLIANAHAVAFDGGALMRLVARLGSEIIAAAAIPFLVLMAAAVAGNMIQHRFLWSTEPLRPALSKVSPAAGLKRLFSRQALVNFAKGADAVALRIRAVAEEARVPIVENPPLARALHATVELDQEIPPEHYKAVAEVISYVMRLSGAVRW